MENSDMESCGQLLTNFTWTDKELERAILSTSIVHQYLSGRGERFGLVIDKLEDELESLKRYAQSREWSCEKIKTLMGWDFKLPNYKEQSLV